MSATMGNTSPAPPPRSWLRTKLRNYFPEARRQHVRALEHAIYADHPGDDTPLFANPFTIEDVSVLDDATLHAVLTNFRHSHSVDALSHAFHGASPPLLDRIASALPPHARARFWAHVRRPVPPHGREHARRRLLDDLFWDLTYWKTPDLYEALTEGERLHPALFPLLAPHLQGKTVLDAGAGSGRATLECLRHGAHHVHAVEPSPGLLRILERKLLWAEFAGRITVHRGRFDAIPLPDDSVDTALACSAFTSEPAQGGEPGLAELRRVTRAGGIIVIIWPRPADYAWLAAHGFHYVALPVPPRMSVHFRSLATALRVARRFYAHNRRVLRHLLATRRPEVPFSLLGYNPPHDYAWLPVEK